MWLAHRPPRGGKKSKTTSAAWGQAEGGKSRLTLVVDMGWLLAGEAPRWRPHDPVGQVATRAACSVRRRTRPRHVIGAPNRTVSDLGQRRAGWSRPAGLVGAGRPTGTTGARGEGEVRDAGAAAVEPAVARAGALGVDAERLAARSTSSAISRLAGAALVSSRSTGSIPCPRTTRPASPQPGAGEVVGLGEEDHLARDDQRDGEAVDERQVVARQMHRRRWPGTWCSPSTTGRPHGTGESGCDDSVARPCRAWQSFCPQARVDQNARAQIHGPRSAAAGWPPRGRPAGPPRRARAAGRPSARTTRHHGTPPPWGGQHVDPTRRGPPRPSRSPTTSAIAPYVVARPRGTDSAHCSTSSA